MNTAFDTDGSLYMGSRRDPAGCRVGLFGVPYDGTTSFRPGTRFGPAAIREVSNGLETYCPQLDRDLDDLAFADLGAVDIPFGAPEPVVEAVRESTEAVLNLGLRPLMLGGEHSISSGAVAAVAARYPDMVMVQLDAHADLRDGYDGEHFSHAAAMRRCLDFPGVELVSVGIRNISAGEVPFLEANRDRIHIYWGKDRAAWNVEEIVSHLAGKTVYITFDLDGFDASLMQATGTPEPGGVFWDDAVRIIRRATEVAGEVVGADINELAPIEGLHSCNFLAAKLAYKILGYRFAAKAAA